MTKGKQITCKSCKEAVEKNAKECPHCGVKNPTVNAAQGCLGFVVLSVVLGLGMYACSDNSETQQVAESSQQSAVQNHDEQMEQVISYYAVDYEITRSQDLSHGSRTRYNSNILAPTALTHEQQVATAAKAAKQIQNDKRVQVSSVNLMIEKDGVPKVAVSYAPDQKGWSGETNTGNRFNLEN